MNGMESVRDLLDGAEPTGDDKAGRWTPPPAGHLRRVVMQQEWAVGVAGRERASDGAGVRQ